MEKTLVFDMDGTIADLYGVEGWLDMLRDSNPTPYAIAKPLYDMEMLNALLIIFKGMGWRIVVTTWLSMGSTPEYDAQVRGAKISWLDKMGFEYDEIHGLIAFVEVVEAVGLVFFFHLLAQLIGQLGFFLSLC